MASARDPEIGIVGAGASGLAVAQALWRRGYRRLTLLERERRVGGKCFTIQHEGRTYELGAGGVTLRYRNVRAMLAEADIRGSPVLSHSFVELDDRPPRAQPLPTALLSLRLGAEGARFARELLVHRSLKRPGFASGSPDLCVPFARWCEARRVEGVAEALKPWITGFGYGFYDELSAAYALKYVSLFSPLLFDLPREGFGGLWERVARSLPEVNIKLDSPVVLVRRDAAGADVVTEESSLRFDQLVIACPLDEVSAFLDVTAEERDLCSRVRHEDYYAVAAEAEGLPRSQCVFFPSRMTPEHVGEPMFAYARFPARGLTLFYGFAKRPWEPALACEAVRATVDRLGGRVLSTPFARCWRYFPHVSSEDMAGGYYARLEALQGQRATYWCGEVHAFATVETVVAYARALVERFFPARPSSSIVVGRAPSAPRWQPAPRRSMSSP